jgi:hypothetical protein
MKELLLTICNNLFSLLCAAIIVFCQRYLLGLSTWEKDKRWLRRQKWYNTYERLRYYRGSEIIHQLRAYRLLETL